MQSFQCSKSIERKRLVLTPQLENNGLLWPYESLVCTNRNAPCNLRFPEPKQYGPLTKTEKKKEACFPPAGPPRLPSVPFIKPASWRWKQFSPFKLGGINTVRLLSDWGVWRPACCSRRPNTGEARTCHWLTLGDKSLRLGRTASVITAPHTRHARDFC